MEQIAERIRMGDLGAGDRLPSERELAAAMQISRPTLREAVQVLASAGVLAVRRGSSGGIFVASGYVPYEILRSKSQLRLGEIAGVLQARRLLEPQVAQLASVNAKTEDYDALEANIHAHRVLLESGDAFIDEDRFLQLDTQFHLRMAQSTRNATIVSLMRTLLRQLEIARDQAMHQPIADWVIDVHERTLAAIRSGDRARIELVMDEHLGAMEHEWERRADQPGPEALLSSGA